VNRIYESSMIRKCLQLFDIHLYLLTFCNTFELRIKRNWSIENNTVHKIFAHDFCHKDDECPKQQIVEQQVIQNLEVVNDIKMNHEFLPRQFSN